MMDSKKLQELLSGAKLPWTGDRDDGTVKYHIFNSEGESVYRSSYNSGLDIGFQYRSGISEDEFMAMMNYLPELLAENARLKERLRWVPVSERLPDNYLSVLLFAGDYVRFGWHTTIDGASWHTDSGLWLRANMGYNTVTHWMPLPALPEVGE